MVIRKSYLDKLISYQNKKIIKVVTGIRRCGKSTLLNRYKEYLIKSGINKKNIISINFEDYSNEYLKNPKVLHEYILDLLVTDEITYIILDEVQEVNEFQKVVNSLYLKSNVDIYLTGSNSHLLSGELATLLTGRYIKIEMMPLSFKEFVSVKNDDYRDDDIYLEYLVRSSFPYALSLEIKSNQVSEYLKSILDTILLNDIVARKNIKNVMMLKSVLQFIMDNIGNELSIKKIADTMTSHGRVIDSRTVESYINAYIDSFLVYYVKRYDIKGKQYLKTLGKCYIADIGLRNAFLGNKGNDVGHILENVVFLELKRRGYDVYIGKIGNTEVDFVAMNFEGIKYFQVSASVREEQTLVRELKSLKSIADHYPKYLLTLDKDPIADYNGIKKMNVLEWLKE